MVEEKKKRKQKKIRLESIRSSSRKQIEAMRNEANVSPITSLTI